MKTYKLPPPHYVPSSPPTHTRSGTTNDICCEYGRLPHPHIMGFGTNIILSLELSYPTRVQNPTSSTIDPNDEVLGRSILNTIAYTKLHNNQQTICLSSTKFTLDLTPIGIHPRY